jgi:DnaJ-class molecular chaperone
MALDHNLYFISVAARMLGMHPQTLRKYERLGLVQPTRTIGSMRVYSRDELERLKLIKRLVDDGGINLAGVQRLLSIAEVAQRMRPLMRESRSIAMRGDSVRNWTNCCGCSASTSHGLQRLLLDAWRGKTATDKEIKQAFRKLARKHHPDVNPGDKAAESRFKEINEAYEVLGDADKRKKYDELGANWRMYEQAEAGAPPRPSQGGGGFRTMTEEEMREMFGNADPFSDFFHTFFGGAMGGGGQDFDEAGRRTRGRARGPRAGRDVEQEIELGLEDAYRGTMRRLSMNYNGEARWWTSDSAGVSEGSRVRVAAEGERGSGGAKAGDLYLRIRLAPHGQFERKGRDLYVHVPIPLTTAVLGGEAEVKPLGGKPLRLKIPPTTQNGQVFRLKGHGMPVTGKTGEQGDLYATVDVQLPRELSAEQRTHFEALQKLETGPKGPSS